MTKIVLVALSSPGHYSYWNSLSAETLAGDLRGHFRDQINVQVVDMACDAAPDYISGRIAHSRPDIIGFSVYPGTAGKCLDIVRRLDGLPIIQERKPLLAFGNKVPTYFPEQFLRSDLRSVVVMGEAEDSFRGLVEHVTSKRPLESIPNLAFMSVGGLRTTERSLPDPQTLVHPPGLDTIPRVLRNGGNALVQTSRGCSWSECSFCIINSWRLGQAWAALPTDRVLANIRQLAQAGVSEIEFADDDFMGPENDDAFERLRTIAQGIADAGRESATTGRITFRIFLNPHQVYRPSDGQWNARVRTLLLELREAGLVKVYIGLDSGCESQLRRYRRPATLRHIEGALGTLRSLRIGIDVGFIMFDPLLRLQEMIENVRTFREWNLIEHNQWPFRPMEVYPGAMMFAEMRDRGLLGVEDSNFGAYAYAYDDPRVQRIAEAIDHLSQPYRALFYALKSISKRQYDLSRKDQTTLRAQHYVEQNGLVFLELMEAAGLAFLDSQPDALDSLCDHAREVIHGLVCSIDREISEGLIADSDGFLRLQIACLRDTILSPKSITIGT